MSELYSAQESWHKQILAAFTNFKKSPKERLTWNYINTKKELLDDYWGKLQDNHKKILEDKTPVLDKYLESYFEVEDIYASYKDLILTKLSDLKPLKVEKSPEAPVQHIKLPPIQIPKFDGQYNNWTSFHDQFVSLVHTNSTLDNVNKLHMLKQSLVGEAANLLKNITITENNYEYAWTKLKKRYSNKRIIINSYLQRFLSLRSITSENPNAIRNLLDTTTDCLSGLHSIGVDINSWDPFIIYILTNKLDIESIKHWEQIVNINSNEQLPTLKQFTEYLEMRFRSLEGAQSSKGNLRAPSNPNLDKKTFLNLPREGCVCVVCGGEHYIFRCKQFSQMSVEQRKRFIEKNKLCFNCLIPNHGVKTCRQQSCCRICGKRHHSLIHLETTPPKGSEPELNISTPNNHNQPNNTNTVVNHAEVSSHYASDTYHNNTSVLLATAIVKIVASNGKILHLRALIDQGSEGSFITESATQTLGLRKNTVNGTISGLGNNVVMKTKYAVSFTLQSDYDKTLQLPVRAHVLTALTRLLPSRKINNTWNHLQGLTLADPEYGKPSRIDLLLGAEVYSRIMLDGIISGSEGSPLAQHTRVGWLLSGEVYSTNSTSSNNHLINTHITTYEDLQLQKFWEIESDYNQTMYLTEDELQCERIFAETHSRDKEGRYIVKIPFKDNQVDYGDTKQIAERRLEQIERRLNKNKELKIEYTRVLMEYLHLNHMNEITQHTDLKGKYYMAHHPVIRTDKTTSKLRIVFDASCKGPNGKSLNENMLIGPKLQQDLRHIIMRWRIHEIAFTADCIKMYRQIKVDNESADFQRILWRINGEVKEYQLNRVTFGTASAPYLATKTLQQLATDEQQKYPEASLIAKSDFYMDDLLSGADNLETAYAIYEQMTNLMKAGGFMLQKWASNERKFTELVKRETTNTDENYVINFEDVVKTLGIKWNRATDTFQYEIKSPSLDKLITKRLILSEISQLFDPMGWLTPVIIKAKILIQALWLSRIGWDDEVSSEIRQEWLQFRESLVDAENIKIPRWYNTNKNDLLVELHGYSDASQVAYAAVIYLRVVKTDKTIHTRLVTAKSKVAPIKSISVPRLELCGALLLSKLLREVSDLLNIQQTNVYAYTDSSIVLAWLQKHPSRWKTFVGNRTSEILNLLPSVTWSHIDTAKNPADIASRGTTPLQLQKSESWWLGPDELLKTKIKITQLKDNTTEIEKKPERKINTMATTLTQEEEFNLLNRYSNLTKLLRITAYILRVFTKNKPNHKHLIGIEINKARETCIKICQREAFQEELERLEVNKEIKKNSRLTTLNPFLDHGVIKVGGRLQNSTLPDYTKHQIILPEKHPFTELILFDAHLKTMHGGPSLLLSYVRKQYWILHAKNLAKKVVHQCVTCIRFRAATKNQIMGSLPEVRVTPCKPFLKCGVDFAGPIDLRLSKGRGCKTQKSYLAIFVCMVTRAIHIEIVTSLMASDFIAAFKRFVARRGHCSDMWSDNATNLSAGGKELKILFDRANNDVQEDIKNLLANDGTTWHHIPASAPHFGGLWEAGVKSIKHHLKRVLKDTTLTYEEMSTVTSQIEACLNSRPISPMSDDPTDFLPLTPAHFLVGEASIIVPEEDYLTSKVNRLTRWQLTQRIIQDFWNRWSREYLARLQQRPKWMTKQKNVEIGQLVLIKEDNTPPSKWFLGRIVDIHPGSDNLVRVVSVKCKNSIFKRPITKICCLPIDNRQI